MTSKEEKLKKSLDSLDDVQGIKGAAVVRRDGLLIASNLGSDIDDDQVGAMTASAVGSGETASDSLGMGSVDAVTIESKDGKLVCTGAGDQGILAILTKPDVNMGLVKVEMGNATDKIKRVL
jgi:predicted regulator of Ras-like GTPase activity (Roadblock/LC7/MglB family)